MTTPSSSSLSHALNPPITIPRSQQELPRLQLAPPEHQKQPHQPRQQQTFQVNPQQQESAPHRPDEASGVTPISSSREVSPVVGVEYIPTTSAGDKRKNTASNDAQQKKRRTEDHSRNPPVQYNLGSHYPYAYLYPPTALPPPALAPYAAPPPPPAPQTPSDMSFNEFQWRLLNLCGEFYEAATELLRATPHPVLSQAFQLLHRGGSGADPVTILNDARRTCDMLLTNPQALAAPPPPPTNLSLPVLNSLAHLNTRAAVPPPISAPPPPPAPATSYYPPPLPPQAPPTISAPVAPPSAPPPRSTSLDKSSSGSKPKDKEKTSSNIQGTWKEHEVEKLKALAEKYRTRERPTPQEEEEEEEDIEDAEGVPDDDAAGSTNGAVPGNAESNTATVKKSNIQEIDWDKVVAEFGEGRSRHQVLIKATYLGLKPSSSLPGKKLKKKKSTPPPTEAPAPTFSSASAKAIPSGYVPALPPPLTTTPLVTKAVTPIGGTTGSTSSSPQGPPPHPSYPQPGWYPQNPYYPYPQPMYYPGPQVYNYAHPPQPGYYNQPYVPPATNTSNADETESEKRGPGRPRKSNGTKPASNAPIPPPSLPPKVLATQVTSTSQTLGRGHQSEKGDDSTTATPKPNATPVASASSTGTGLTSSTPSTATPALAPHSTGGTAGVLRRPTGSTSLFTYTPLPHGSVPSGEGG